MEAFGGTMDTTETGLGGERATKRFSGLAKLSLDCLGAAVLLLGLHTYLDEWAPYREIRGYPKDKIELIILRIAAWIGAFGAVLSLTSCVVIKVKREQLKGFWWAVAAMILNALTCFFAVAGITFKGW